MCYAEGKVPPGAARRCEQVHPRDPKRTEAIWNANRRGSRARARIGDTAALLPGYIGAHIADRAELIGTTTDPAVLTAATADTTAVRLAVVANPATPTEVLQQLHADREQPRAVKRAVRKVLRERRVEQPAHAETDATFRPAPVVEPEAAPTVDADLLRAVERSRDPEYRRVLQALIDEQGEAEDRAQQRRAARELRKARKNAPLTAWVRARPNLDLEEWAQTPAGQAAIAVVLAELDAA